VWAWKKRRAKTIAHSVDRLLCFFPFEPPLFNRFHAGQADFVGHPLVDMIPSGMDCRELAQELNLRPQDRLVLLGPGSREREVTALLGIFDRAVELALPRLITPGGRTVVAVARSSEVPQDVYRRYTHLPLIEGRYRECC